MKIELVRINESNKAVLRQLMELYLYDFSEFDHEDVNEHGVYGYRYLDHYWTEAGRHPFFIQVDDQLAGFVLIRRLTPPDETPVIMAISEFFVMRK